MFPQKCYFLVTTLFVLAVAVVAAVPAVAQTTWTGAADNTTWNNAGNWSSGALPASTDDIVFDATGSYNDGGADGDVDIAIGAAFTINSLNISGDLGSASGVTQSDANETHNLLDGGAGAGPLTIDGADGSGFSINYVAPASPGTSVASRNHNVRFNAPIVFTVLNPIISRSGDDSSAKQLIFNRNVTAADQVMTLSNTSSNINDAIRFDNNSTTTWASTLITQGAVRSNGGTGVTNTTLGVDGSTVTTASVGNTSVSSDPGDGGTHNNFNNWVLGTAGWTEFSAFGGTATTETFNINGNITGGAANVDFDLDSGNNDLLVFTAASTIDVLSRLNVEGVPSDQTGSRITFDGTIIQAAGGVVFASDVDRTVNGSGTIHFDLDKDITSGATNYNNLAWDVRTNFEIDGFTVDFNLTNGSLTAAEYVLVDYGLGATPTGSLAGTTAFASVIDLPTGYFLDYTTNSQIRLVVIPEPSFLGMLGIGCVGLAARRHRRRT